MNPQILACRAISAEYVRRVIKPFFVTLIAILAALIVGAIVMAGKFSSWWLLLLIPSVPLLIISGVITFILLRIVHIAEPDMSPEQQRKVKNYVQSITDVSEVMQTSRIMVIFKIVLDIYKRRWKDGYLHQTAIKSVSLKKDFEDLVSLFR